MINLQAETTFRLPFQAANVVDLHRLEEADALLATLEPPAVVLSGGSNWIQVEPFFSGTVIRPRLLHMVVSTHGTRVDLRVGAGMVWHDLVMQTLASGWFGLENLALIPGWVGAAPVQNIGAYGVELATVCSGVSVWDFATKSRRRLSAAACQFGYRDSVFKQMPSRYLILEVELQLSTIANPQVTYGAIRETVHAQGGDIMNPCDVATAVIEIRKAKLPDPQVTPNVGSFFKNPVISDAALSRLQAIHPEVPSYPDPQGHKVAAGYLLDRAGWRGYWHGSVGVHANQALVLVNRGDPVLDDLAALVGAIRDDVQTRYGIWLEIEPTQVGGVLA